MIKTLNLNKWIILSLLLPFFVCSNIFAQSEASYTVKSGDTLYNISKRLNVTIAELKEWNNMSGNEIELGQILTYYRPDENETSEEVPQNTSDPLISTSKEIPTKFYIVKSGDTLYEIAQEHDMSVDQLRTLNNLSGSTISIGQRLTVKKQASNVTPNIARNTEGSAPQGVFSVYKVRDGDSKEAVLERFKMSENELRSLNPEFNLDELIEGEEITVLLPPSRNYENPYAKDANLQALGEVEVLKYGNSEIGSATTTGELYDPDLLTAAHSNISLGSIIFIENPITENGVYVKVNDRITEAGIKLSEKAYDVLNLSETGEPAISIYTEVND
jgi:LysM repeat protein